MCLTFCHRRRVVYNNHTCDVCEDCVHRLGGAGRCEQCMHYAGNDVCDLTKARVPRWRRCCHWNVERDARFEFEVGERPPMIPMEAVDSVLLEREYRGDINLFAEEWGLDLKGISVTQIAVPLVYGIRCGEWHEAMCADAEGWGVGCEL